MTVLVWVLALVVASVHVLAFVWESLLFQRPAVHRGVFGVRTADVPPVRLWAFNVGFYNLFLASGLVAGVVAWAAGAEVVGRTLVVYGCAFAALAGLVLLVSDRLALSRPRGSGARGAVAQSGPALATLLVVALAG
ncbi:MAG TPA: DUF1304 domain-containing protein [Pedococcus sp.]